MIDFADASRSTSSSGAARRTRCATCASSFGAAGSSSIPRSRRVAAGLRDDREPVQRPRRLRGLHVQLLAIARAEVRASEELARWRAARSRAAASRGSSRANRQLPRRDRERLARLPKRASSSEPRARVASRSSAQRDDARTSAAARKNASAAAIEAVEPSSTRCSQTTLDAVSKAALATLPRPSTAPTARTSSSTASAVGDPARRSCTRRSRDSSCRRSRCRAIATAATSSAGSRSRTCPGAFPYTAGVFPLKRTDEDPTRSSPARVRPSGRTSASTSSRGTIAGEAALDGVRLASRSTARTPHERPDIYGKIGESGVSASARSTT